MIFHIPMKIDLNQHSGSQIRPLKMIAAFKSIGYEVDVITGYCSDRKKQINRIKTNIKDGMHYTFLYSESSTMPTALTEENHFPKCPFLDFGFFNFCKKHTIPIGLFYRDIYWIFEHYTNNTSFLKRNISRLFYKYDLVQYKKYVDCLYLPSIAMGGHIPLQFKNNYISLPPAIEIREHSIVTNESLQFVYVGGISEVYNLKMFTNVISECRKI